MKIRIQHRTTYSYSQPVKFGQHRIMVRPREGHDVHIESSVLDISPGAHHPLDARRQRQQPGQGRLSPSRRTSSSSTANWSSNSTTPTRSISSSRNRGPLSVRLRSREPAPNLHRLHGRSCIRATRRALREWQAQFWKPGDKIETFALLQRINRHIFENFKYQRRDEAGRPNAGGNAEEKQRLVPRLRHAAARGLPLLGTGGAFCQRLHAVRGDRGRRRFDSRMDGSLSSRRGMEGLRSDLRRHDRRAARHRRGLAQPGKRRAHRRFV